MIAAAALRGQTEASGLLYRLAVACPTGDELHEAVIAITGPLDPGVDARLRGFCRTIQKAIEAEREPVLTQGSFRPDRTDREAL
jgi:hypothetical protein